MPESSNMHDPASIAVGIFSGVIGSLAPLVAVTPHDAIMFILAPIATGAISGTVGFFVARICRNIFKRLEGRRFMPSLLDDPDKKD